MTKRTVRLNSLLKEVISEVIHRDLHHVPHVNEFITITAVDITSDLSYAKVFVSVIGDQKQKKLAVQALQEKAGTIARMSSKKVVMRHFPELTFEIDSGLEKQLHMEEVFSKLSQEREKRPSSDDAPSDDHLLDE